MFEKYFRGIDYRWDRIEFVALFVLNANRANVRRRRELFVELGL